MKRDNDTGLTMSGLTIDQRCEDVAYAGRLPAMRFRALRLSDPALSRLAVLLMLARHGRTRTIVRSPNGS